MESHREYFERAERLLDSFPFPTKQHRRVWELYCSGLSIRKIAQKVRLPKSTAFDVVNSIEAQAGLKLPGQLREWLKSK